jgi:hypothetical protein
MGIAVKSKVAWMKREARNPGAPAKSGHFIKSCHAVHGIPGFRFAPSRLLLIFSFA